MHSEQGRAHRALPRTQNEAACFAVVAASSGVAAYSGGSLAVAFSGSVLRTFPRSPRAVPSDIAAAWDAAVVRATAAQGAAIARAVGAGTQAAEAA